MKVFINTPQCCYPKNIPEADQYIFIEHPYLFGIRPNTSGGKMKFHPFKWILLRAAGSYYCEKSFPKKHTFIPFQEIPDYHLPQNAEWILFEHTDIDFTKQLEQLAKKSNSTITWITSPLFILDYDYIQNYPTKKRLQQTPFYIENRKLFQILVKNNKPTGGKWTYDTENRQPLPPNYPLPKIPISHSPDARKHIKKAIEWVQTMSSFTSPYFQGNLEDFWCPITPKDALKWFKSFLKKRFQLFGEFQDGITKRTDYPYLFHSAISSSLNIGLLEPMSAIQMALSAKAPLPAQEGFIRQILGWREFQRLIYYKLGNQIRSMNYFHHQRRLTDAWYLGQTQIPPLDDAIHMAFHYGYLHHILRLMVVSNLMNLATIHPDDVYRWFMEFSVDSWDWVMIGNVYSMGLYADGGLTTSKVYISSSNYEQIRESDYKEVKEPENWRKVWDSLYWNMIGTNPDAMKAMGRFGPIQKKFWERKTDTEKKEFQQIAKDFIQNLTHK